MSKSRASRCVRVQDGEWERKGGVSGWTERPRGMNAKTAADNNSSLGAGSEKQTQHQATGSASLATKGRDLSAWRKGA